jgi:hypothetical protein
METKAWDALKELRKNKKIGVTGFEPATSRPPAVRSSQAEPYPEFFSLYHGGEKKSTINFHFYQKYFFEKI